MDSTTARSTPLNCNSIPTNVITCVQVGTSYEDTSDDEDHRGDEPLIQDLDLDQLSARVPASSMESTPEKEPSTSFSVVVREPECNNKIIAKR